MKKEFTDYYKFCDIGLFTESSIKIRNETIRHKRLYTGPL